MAIAIICSKFEKSENYLLAMLIREKSKKYFVPNFNFAPIGYMKGTVLSLIAATLLLDVVSGSS